MQSIGANVVLSGVVLLIGLFLVYQGQKWFRLGRHIRSTPTAKPGSVAAGRAEVTGVAQPHREPLVAPFTGEECVYLDWTLEEWVDGDWKEIASETRIEPFYVEDDSGRVLVRADEHPNLEDLPWEYDSRRFTTEEAGEVEAFLDQFRSREAGGATISNPATTANPAVTENPSVTSASEIDAEPADQYRYIKRLLPPGTPLYVFGSLEPQYGMGESGFELDPVTNMFFIARSNEKLLNDQAYFLGIFTFLSGLFFLGVGLLLGADWILAAFEWIDAQL